MMPLATTDGKKTREVKWEYNLDKKTLIKKKNLLEISICL